MEEPLIIFETAKLAQKKGFDLDDYNDIHYVYNTIGVLEKIEPSKNILIGEKDFLAPTQSLLQKWLREKHNINFLSICGCGADKIPKWYKFTLPNCYTPNKKDGNTSTSTTYEEALEITLQEALKLIKN